jgi:hypothetical protein
VWAAGLGKITVLFAPSLHDPVLLRSADEIEPKSIQISVNALCDGRGVVWVGSLTHSDAASPVLQ